MSTGLIKIIKTASLDAMNNAQLCDLRYGKVVSTNPLSVRVTNLFVIPSSALVVPEHLTDYKVDVVEDGIDKTITVKNALKVGDKVALLRSQGGQSYYILNRV